MLNAKLKDMCGSDEYLSVQVVAETASIDIYPKGYGEYDAPDGQGAPIRIEYWENELRVILATDINGQNPIIIKMEGALESRRK